MAKTLLQQQQATCIQVFCVMFQTYLDRYNRTPEGAEKNLMKMILETHLFTYNALPDRDKSTLYMNNIKVLDGLLEK